MDINDLAPPKGDPIDLKMVGDKLDGIVENTAAVFEAKFMLPWSFSEEAAAEKYMAQLQHNMWVTHLRSSVLSIITGGGKHSVRFVVVRVVGRHRPAGAGGAGGRDRHALIEQHAGVLEAARRHRAHQDGRRLGAHG